MTERITLSADLTIALTSPSSTVSGTISLVLVQDTTGGYAVTWPAELKWTYGPLTTGIGWAEDFQGVTPQFVWPQDGAWCIATGIDFAFTLIGGCRSAINRVLASATSGVFEVDTTDDMSWDSDTSNDEWDPAPERGNPFP